MLEKKMETEFDITLFLLVLAVDKKLLARVRARLSHLNKYVWNKIKLRNNTSPIAKNNLAKYPNMIGS